MTSPKLSAFEKVTTNLDILGHLFGFLSIGDQFRIANITEHLQFVVANYMLPDVNFNKICIKKYSDTVRLKSDRHKEEFILTYEEYEYFLNIFGHQVQSFNESHGNAFNVTHQLKNLTSINYNYLLVTKPQIQLIAENCPLLEDFSINGCCNKKHELIRLMVDIDISSLLAMTRLKTFSLKTGLSYKIKYGFHEELTRKTKLPLHSTSSIENFDIYMPALASRFLGLFPHLHTMSITVFYPISNEEIIAMGHACQQLKELSFILSSFENVEKFSVIKNLKELFFYHCEGLTYENLKDILTRTQLVTFGSIGTKYEGPLFHYYFLTPTMKSIYIDAIKSFDFKTEMEFYKERKKPALTKS